MPRLKMRLIRRMLFFLCSLLPIACFTQVLTLEKSQELARLNYPLVKQKQLIRQTADINIANLGKSYLPQLSLGGQATYQSDVTQVSIPVSGFKIEPPGKDQYKVTADINQLLYDGGTTKHQKALQLLNASVEDQQVEVELYSLKERINQVFLSILYLDEQMKQADLIKEDLQTGIKKVEAQVENKIAFRSSLNLLKAEWLKADQRLIELKASRKGLTETLGLFLNRQLDENVKLEKPETPILAMASISRPEITLFSNQSQLLDHQKKLIEAKNRPRSGLFFQGGYGRPALNLLKNEFDFFYIGGIRLNWSLGGLYIRKKEKQLIDINQQIVHIRKDQFLLNTNTQLTQQATEIEKLNKLITSDNEIIALRVSVKNAAKAQLENGVITANDYLREVNAEDLSRQAMISHQLQLLQATINYSTITGK
ncbi:MAG: TolC family protein [Chitinophagaceae bacterium]